MMEKIIAACGNDCAACPRYVGHPYEKTDEELHHTAELSLFIRFVSLYIVIGLLFSLVFVLIR